MVSHWFLTSEDRVPLYATLCALCGRQSGTRAAGGLRPTSGFPWQKGTVISTPKGRRSQSKASCRKTPAYL
jgi:hypothetical protein